MLFTGQILIANDSFFVFQTNPRIEWQNFPALKVLNPPDVLGGTPGINSNYTLTSGSGRVVQLSWEEPGKVTGYDNSYKTSTVAGEAKVSPALDHYREHN